MKKTLQILSMLILASSVAMAQWTTDSVTMGPGYANNIFYALGNGVQKTSPAHNWHLAFSMNGLDSASIFANQTGSSTTFFTRVYDVNRPISDWANVSYSDTLTGDLLYNGADGWYQGALNAISNPSPVDFGWGTYNTTSHLFTGTRLFMMEAGGNFYKMAIDSMNPFTYDWHFRIEPMSPSLPPYPTYTISKSNGYANRMFAYFNIDSGAAYDREPDVSTWDFQFVGYPTFIPAGPQSAWRAVQGVLTNRGIPAAKAHQIHVDTAMMEYQSWTASWMTNWESNPYTTIGYDWKTFDLGTFSYIVPDSISYFIAAQDNNIYQLQFLEFGGGQNGNIKFRYRNLGASPLDIKDKEVFGEATLYPNPSYNHSRLMFNAAENTNARLTITAMNGQVVLKSNEKVQAGLNVFEINTANMPVGNYVVSIQSDRGFMSKKMTVSR